MEFSGTSYYNVGNITLPPSGVDNFTFTWTVPIGFDDLSAAVVMDAFAGPPPPAPPPHAPGTFCGCMLTPDATFGKCPAGTQLGVVSLANDSSVTYRECLPNAQYNIFTRMFAFSHCFSWDCFPAAFKGRSFTITVANITQYNIADMPAGVWQVRVSDCCAREGRFQQQIYSQGLLRPSFLRLCFS